MISTCPKNYPSLLLILTYFVAGSPPACSPLSHWGPRWPQEAHARLQLIQLVAKEPFSFYYFKANNHISKANTISQITWGSRVEICLGTVIKEKALDGRMSSKADRPAMLTKVAPLPRSLREAVSVPAPLGSC